MDYLLVGLGGFLGTNARYLVAHWIGARYGTSFPYATLVINVSGSFVIGLFLILVTERFLVHPHWRLFFSVGFLGGYTTFSTFSFESLALIQNGYWLLGLINMIGSVVLGLGATLCGVGPGTPVLESNATMLALLTTTVLFVLTACAEMLGCYTVYLWLKAARSTWWLVPGVAGLGLFAWLLTLHPSSSAGRVYAAYGGVYIATAMFWQWAVEHQRPDRWDVLGAGVCLTGMAIIMLGPRAS